MKIAGTDKFKTKVKIPYKNRVYNVGTVFILRRTASDFTGTTNGGEYPVSSFTNVIELREYKEELPTFNKDGSLNMEKALSVDTEGHKIYIPETSLYLLFDPVYEV